MATNAERRAARERVSANHGAFGTRLDVSFRFLKDAAEADRAAGF